MSRSHYPCATTTPHAKWASTHPLVKRLFWVCLCLVVGVTASRSTDGCCRPQSRGPSSQSRSTFGISQASTCCARSTSSWRSLGLLRWSRIWRVCRWSLCGALAPAHVVWQSSTFGQFYFRTLRHQGPWCLSPGCQHATVGALMPDWLAGCDPPPATIHSPRLMLTY